MIVRRKANVKLVLNIILTNAWLLKSRDIKKFNEIGKKVTSEKTIKEAHVDVGCKTINNWLLRQDYKYEKQAQQI